MPQEKAAYSPSNFEKCAAYAAAAVVVGGSMFLVIRNQPFADQNLVVITRTILSFAMAVLGATVPGFLTLGWKGGGLAVRAGGALALFVLTFTYTPTVLPLGSNKEGAVTDLSIIDTVAQGGTVNVKLKNSGTDSAFVKRVSFVQRFAYGGSCSGLHYAVMPTVYDYPLKYKTNGQVGASVLQLDVLSERQGRSREYGLAKGLPTSRGELCKTGREDKIASSSNDTIFDACISYYRDHRGRDQGRQEVAATGIELSQKIPPRGVDSIDLVFSAPLSMVAPGDHIITEGYAVLYRFWINGFALLTLDSYLQIQEASAVR